MKLCIISRQFQHLPCLPDYFHTSPIFVLSDKFSTIVIAFTVLVLIVASEDIFFTMLTLLFTSEELHSGKLSTQTFQSQTRFLCKPHLQVLPPLPTLLLPLTYAILSILGDYCNQPFNNLFVISASFHGVVSSLVLIILHSEYRRPLFCFRRNILHVEEIQKDSSSSNAAVVFHRRHSIVVIN